MADWVTIYSTSDQTRAELLRQLLQHNKISCRLLNKQDSSYMMFGEVELSVQGADVIQARRLIEKAVE